jgi:hypothetical protein
LLKIKEIRIVSLLCVSNVIGVSKSLDEVSHTTPVECRGGSDKGSTGCGFGVTSGLPEIG